MEGQVDERQVTKKKKRASRRNNNVIINLKMSSYEDSERNL